MQNERPVDDIPLGKLLGVDSVEVPSCPINALDISVRVAHRLMGSGIPRLAHLLLAPRKLLFAICDTSSDVAEIEKELRCFLRERTDWNGREENEFVEDDPKPSQIDDKDNNSGVENEDEESVFDLGVYSPFDSTPLGQILGIDFFAIPSCCISVIPLSINTEDLRAHGINRVEELLLTPSNIILDICGSFREFAELKRETQHFLCDRIGWGCHCNGANEQDDVRAIQIDSESSDPDAKREDEEGDSNLVTSTYYQEQNRMIDFDSVPLGASLSLGANLNSIVHLLDCPIHLLGLSKEFEKWLITIRITNLYKLLRCPRKLVQCSWPPLYDIKEVEVKVCDFLSRYADHIHVYHFEHGPICGDELLPPRTLRDEWQLFAHHRECSLGISLAEWGLAKELRLSLSSLGVNNLDALLDLGWQQLTDCVGYDSAEEIMDRVVETAESEKLEQRYLQPDLWPDPEEVADFFTASSISASISITGFPMEVVEVITQETDSVSSTKYCKRTDLEQLLDSLSDSSGSLFWNLLAYREAWDNAAELGLLEKENFEYRRARMKFDGPTLSDSMDAFRSACTESDWFFLSKRFGLENEGTLQTFPQISCYCWDWSISRAKRIVATALDKLRREQIFVDLQQTMRFFVERAGGALTLQDAMEQLENYFLPCGISSAFTCRLLLETHPDFVKVSRGNFQKTTDSFAPYEGSIYVLKERIEDFGRVIECARKLWMKRTEAIESALWSETVSEQLCALRTDVNATFVRACLRADGRFSPDRFERMKVRRKLDEVLVEVLREYGEPAHFKLLSDKVNEATSWERRWTPPTVYRQLNSEMQLFVRVEDGVYGLLEWGLEHSLLTHGKGRKVAELIEEFLKEQEQPCRLEAIVEYVMERKRVTRDRVLKDLFYEPQFKRFTQAKWGLRRWKM